LAILSHTLTKRAIDTPRWERYFDQLPRARKLERSEHPAPLL